jgi:purine nucleosidase
MILTSVVGLLGLSAAAWIAAAAPVPLIIDTDAGFDVDDVGAVCLGNALQDNGETEIIAVGHTNGYVKGIGAVSALMHFYDRDSVPLGSYKGPWAQNPRAPGAKGTADRYVPDLASNYPVGKKDSTQTPTAVEVYRVALARAADRSVAIAAIGITTNMRDLIQSKPDRFSPLDGKALVAQKVKLIVWMDGLYNFGCAQHDEDNWLGPDTGCRGSAKAAVEAWPSSVKQIFSGVGGDVMHGAWLEDCAAKGNPCRQAFEDWGVAGRGRSSWDPIAVMIAVRGVAGFHCKEVGQGGHQTFPTGGHDGVEHWVGGSASNQTFVQYTGSNAQGKIDFELNQLLCQPPGGFLRSNGVWNMARGENCYGPRGNSPAHGATDIDTTRPVGTITLAECQQHCLDTKGCTAVTVSPKSGGLYDCYRKSDINLRKCDSGTSFTTFVATEWQLAGGYNCWPGHGAKDLRNVQGAIDVRSCQQQCEKTKGCNAVVWNGKAHSGVGACYLKSVDNLSKCDQGTSFDTYLARQPFGAAGNNTSVQQ